MDKMLKILITVFVTCALTLLAMLCRSQVPPPLKDIAATIEKNHEQWKINFGHKKKIPIEFEKQILAALSYFPELKEIRIQVKRNSSGIISTRPAWSSVFRRAGKRKYIIFINDSRKSNWSKFLFRNAGINGQTGIAAHELTHISWFNQRNTFGLLAIGAGHISRAYMDRFENKTDSLCIERGLGHQLLSWNIFLRKAFGMPDPENGPDPFFDHAKRERYMSPASIKRVMRNSKTYQ